MVYSILLFLHDDVSTHIYIYTYIHTYTHIHTHTYIDLTQCGPNMMHMHYSKAFVMDRLQRKVQYMGELCVCVCVYICVCYLLYITTYFILYALYIPKYRYLP